MRSVMLLLYVLISCSGIGQHYIISEKSDMGHFLDAEVVEDTCYALFYHRESLYKDTMESKWDSSYYYLLKIDPLGNLVQKRRLVNDDLLMGFLEAWLQYHNGSFHVMSAKLNIDQGDSSIVSFINTYNKNFELKHIRGFLYDEEEFVNGGLLYDSKYVQTGTNEQGVGYVRITDLNGGLDTSIHINIQNDRRHFIAITEDGQKAFLTNNISEFTMLDLQSFETKLLPYAMYEFGSSQTMTYLGNYRFSLISTERDNSNPNSSDYFLTHFILDTNGVVYENKLEQDSVFRITQGSNHLINHSTKSILSLSLKQPSYNPWYYDSVSGGYFINDLELGTLQFGWNQGDTGYHITPLFSTDGLLWLGGIYPMGKGYIAFASYWDRNVDSLDAKMTPFYLLLNEQGEVVKINEINRLKQHTIEIFPNPCSNYIQLEFENNYLGELYAIHDLNGKQISRGIYNGQITISSLKSGIYLIQIGERSALFVKEN